LVACVLRSGEPEVGPSSEAGTVLSRNAHPWAGGFFTDDEERGVLVEGGQQIG
jgi:hypothetical protein